VEAVIQDSLTKRKFKSTYLKKNNNNLKVATVLFDQFNDSLVNKIKISLKNVLTPDLFNKY